MKDYAVINLNNMSPVPGGEYTYVNLSKVVDPHYRALLLAEYRFVKTIQAKVRKNPETLYRLTTNATEETPLTGRCPSLRAFA